MTGEHHSSRDPSRISIVDDEPGVLRALARMLTMLGHEVTTFGSALGFLKSLDESVPDILLLDLRMPDLDGIGLQEELIRRGFDIPTVFLSAHGDVPSSVRALRRGAVDFLEKPCDESTLSAALTRAAEAGRRARSRRQDRLEISKRAERLTPREHQVFELLVTGRLNKQIAALLGTTPRTIKVHRSRVMTKMEAESIADLVRMFDQLSGAPRGRRWSDPEMLASPQAVSEPRPRPLYVSEAATGDPRPDTT
jgi:FixJ family two-component response regulator